MGPKPDQTAAAAQQTVTVCLEKLSGWKTLRAAHTDAKRPFVHLYQMSVGVTKEHRCLTIRDMRMLHVYMKCFRDALL